MQRLFPRKIRDTMLKNEGTDPGMKWKPHTFLRFFTIQRMSLRSPQEIKLSKRKSNLTITDLHGGLNHKHRSSWPIPSSIPAYSVRGELEGAARMSALVSGHIFHVMVDASLCVYLSLHTWFCPFKFLQSRPSWTCSCTIFKRSSFRQLILLHLYCQM